MIYNRYNKPFVLVCMALVVVFMFITRVGEEESGIHHIYSIEFNAVLGNVIKVS